MAAPQTHERLRDDGEIAGSSDRGFGLVFAALFTIIGLWPLTAAGGPRWWSLALALGFAAAAMLRPRLLAPLNRLWQRFGLVLSKVVSPLVMGIVFFAVITPIALTMRALGKDPLRLRLERGTKSYWIKRQPPPPETMKNQF